jgi:hypothetical protein
MINIRREDPVLGLFDSMSVPESTVLRASHLC